MKINIRRTVIFIGVFSIGVTVGHIMTKSAFLSFLKNETIQKEINKPTASVINQVEIKKNKGELVFSPNTIQTPCDSLLQKFIDTTSVKQFRRMKKD